MKLTNQFTTQQQAERLLEAGLPEWTADCYFTKIAGPGHSFVGPILLIHVDFSVTDKRKADEAYVRWRNTDPENLKKRYPVRYLPDEIMAGWTTGRLLELWLKCYRSENEGQALGTYGAQLRVYMEAMRFGSTPDALEGLVTDLCINMDVMDFTRLERK